MIKNKNFRTGGLTLKFAHETWQQKQQPEIMKLVQGYGKSFVFDLQGACNSFLAECERLRIKITGIELDPLWSYFPLPDASQVLYLDADNAQLYHRLLMLETGSAVFKRVTNSKKILNEGGEELIRLLIGGMYAYRPDSADKWVDYLNDGRREQQEIKEFCDLLYGKDEDFL